MGRPLSSSDAVLAQASVLTEEGLVGFVRRLPDGAWQFGERAWDVDDPPELVATTFSMLHAADPSLASIVDLEPGQQAWRWERGGSFLRGRVPTGPIFFFIFEVVPSPDHPAPETVGGAFVNAWIRYETLAAARALAHADLDAQGWTVVSEEGEERTVDSFEGDSAVHADQARTDGEAYVVNTFPPEGVDERPSALHKLTDLEGAPVAWPHAFERHDAEWGSRLYIGSADDPVRLMGDLADAFGDEVWLLYVLTVSRGEPPVGRYESPPMAPVDVRILIEEFGDLLARDARHQFWIGEVGGPGLLVLDDHGLIYAYGPLGELERRLRARGLVEGEVSIPAPHSHHFHVAFDEDVERLLGEREWRRTELWPEDTGD